MGITSGLNPSNIKEAFKTINDMIFKSQKQNDEFYKYKGFWPWFKNMVNIDDAMVKKACSSDAHIYLLYLRGCAIFLFVLSVVGIFFLSPFYYQGSNEEESTFLAKITVFSITHSNWRIWIMFVISLSYSIVGYYFVYNLISQLKDFRYYKEETDTISEDYHVSKKTILILGITDFLSVEYANKLLDTFLKNRYGSDYRDVRTLGRYHSLYRLLKERIDLATKLNDLMTQLFFNNSKSLLYITFRSLLIIGIGSSVIWQLSHLWGVVNWLGVRFYLLQIFIIFRSRKRQRVRKRYSQISRTAET